METFAAEARSIALASRVTKMCVPSHDRLESCWSYLIPLIFGAFGLFSGFPMAAAGDDTREPSIPPELVARHQFIVRAQLVEIPQSAAVSDQEIEAANEFGSFETLVINSGTLSSRGIVSFLSKVKGVKYVTLNGPGVTDEVIAALGKQLTLERIDLKGPIRGRTLNQWGTLKQQLRFLALQCEPLRREPPSIGETFGLVDEGIKQIGELDGLESLTLVECGIADRHLELLNRLTSLLTLNLDGNPIDGSGLAALAGLKRLNTLTVSSCRLTDRRLKSFPPLDSLAFLSLANNQIGDPAVKAIAAAGLDKLTGLVLNRTDVTDRACGSLKSLKRLEDLALAHTRIANIEALNGLRLNALDLSWSGLSDPGVAQLSGFRQLKVLHLYSAPITDSALPHLAKLGNLQVLYVGNTNLSAASIQMLGATLPDCRINAREEGSIFFTPQVFPRPSIQD
jgi:hypothetical protein